MISLPISASKTITATNSISRLLSFTKSRRFSIPKTSLKPSTTLFSPKFPTSLPFQTSHFTTKSSQNEEALAKSPPTDTNSPTIFEKIISKQIPSHVVYEDDRVLAFRDINPQAPVHVLVIPKVRDGLTQLSRAEERHKEILGELLYVARIVAEREGVKDGYRVVVNDGVEGCQSVYHLHLHVLGGRQMKWPPG